MDEEKRKRAAGLIVRNHMETFHQVPYDSFRLPFTTFRLILVDQTSGKRLKYATRIRTAVPFERLEVADKLKVYYDGIAAMTEQLLNEERERMNKIFEIALANEGEASNE